MKRCKLYNVLQASQCVRRFSVFINVCREDEHLYNDEVADFKYVTSQDLHFNYKTNSRWYTIYSSSRKSQGVLTSYLNRFVRGTQCPQYYFRASLSMILHRLIHDDMMQLLAIKLAQNFEACSRFLGCDCENFIRVDQSLFRIPFKRLV